MRAPSHSPSPITAQLCQPLSSKEKASKPQSLQFPFGLFFSPSPLKEFSSQIPPAQTQKRKFPGIAALSGKLITGVQAAESMPVTSCPVFGHWWDCGQAVSWLPPASTRNQHISQQGLVPHEGYKLICLRRMADLSAFPFLIKAWLWAHQAEEAILK